ncbi:polysaccharide biosynthesis/export family protein [Serratia sp. UGAL515B_01]|uniref:polysaccharide biosynthesis/export family protein n=1 Tax=Serratia sp. UGAL515B_01 TaxID=2986763 RepID=UPI0029559613|nr:polysaccharide biosynthesis/export family protein [Serratia sp. UGAL515B_01]WON78273.1 polysaccharide biosynthesis/export family protein [Serratia sp. UGAL515B_01]
MKRIRRAETGLLVLLVCMVLQGCGLPRSGPMLSEVEKSHGRGDIVLMPVTKQLAAASREAEHASFPQRFLVAQETDVTRLAPGDGVNISLWERDGLQLFASDANGMTNLGEMILDSEGAIYLPYVGKIHAKGLTIGQLHDVIMHRLQGIVIASDVNVQASPRRGQIVIAQGDLSKPGIYPLAQATRLSLLLAQAVPVQRNPEQMAITVQRGGESGSVRLADIYRNPAQNIALSPGDIVVVHDVAQYFTVLGAASVQKRIKLSKRNYSVADALGDANGLNDSLANPNAVFLMRAPDATRLGSNEEIKPIVYQFDFTQPEQMVLANHFVVREGDEIYISDAPFTQVQKVLSAFSSAVGSTRSATVVAQ